MELCRTDLGLRATLWTFEIGLILAAPDAACVARAPQLTRVSGHVSRTRMALKQALMIRNMSFATIAVVSLGAGTMAQRAVGDNSTEDVYVVRSVRLSRVAGTEFCSERRVGFKSENDDSYSFRGMTARSSDGAITSARGPEVGRLHGCFGPTSDPQIVNFYAEGALGITSFTGRGKCWLMRVGFPEPGITPAWCSLELSNLPALYVGGLLTTNSILSREAIGETSDPPGYIQPSIATIRLWKKR